MKKNFFKKLASVLSLAMVVTTVAPLAGTSAQAAATPDIKTRYSTVYEGSSRAYTVKNATGYTVKWAVSGEGKEYAKITSKGKLTVDTDGEKAASNATVVVNAKFYKGTKLVSTRKDAVAIKVSATGVAIKTTADVKAVPAGTTVDFNRTLTPANSTSKTYWEVTNKDGAATTTATIAADGKFVATAIGTYKVTANVKNSKTGKTVATASTEVTVVNKIVTFKAVSPKKLTVELAVPATATLTKDNFSLASADTNTKAYIKTATVSSDKKTVTLELYNELTSGKSYNLTATVDSATLTASLAFVKGSVAKVVAANQIVKADGTAQAIVYNVYDENGLDITDSTTVSFESNVTVTADGKINLNNGVLAYVTVVYTNPTTGAQIKSDKITVTGSTAVASTISAFTIDASAVSGTLGTWPKTVTTSIAKGTTGKAVFVKYIDQYTNEVIGVNGTTVSYESLDPSVFVVDSKTGDITTVNEGVGQFKVTCGSVSQIFTVTVTATAKATSLAVDSSSVVKASKTNSTVNKASVVVNVLDQSGNKFNGSVSSNVLSLTLINGDGVVATTAAGTGLALNSVTAATAGVAKDFYAIKAGTAIFKVTSNDQNLNGIIVSVTVYDTDEVIVKYDLKGVKNLDINHKYDADANTNDYKTTISLQPVNKDGFVVNNTTGTTGAAITVTKPDGTKVTITDGAPDNVDTTAVATSFASLGKYSIVAVKSGTTIATAEFTVTDTSAQPNVYVKTNTITLANAATFGNIANLIAVPTGYTVTGIKFTTSNAAIVDSTSTFVNTLTIKATTADVTLYNVVVQVTATIGGVPRTFEIATNQSITLTK